MHECIFEVSLLLEGEQRDTLLAVFKILLVFEGGFVQKISHFDRRNGLVNPSKLPSLIGHVGDKTRQFQYNCSDMEGAAFLQTLDLFINSPGTCKKF